MDLKNKISLESGHPVEWAAEENYIFQLEPFKDRIRDWLDQNAVIKPKVFRNHLQMFLSDDETMPDLSISRSSSRLSWGIPVPDDPSQTIYVWLDALINYLTVSGYPDSSSSVMCSSWPPDVQVIGKDILKFHAIYWPAFLMAAELELPKRILCHSHWTVNYEKMSKSKGNFIDPLELIQTGCTSEGLRYFLLREGTPHSDANYNEDKMKNYLNSELANTLGNLLNRTTGKSVNLDQSTYDYNPDYTSVEGDDLIQCCEELSGKVEQHFEDFNYYLGIDEIMECLRRANGLVQAEETWNLKKSGQLEKLGAVLHLAIESQRVCAILLQPIIPHLSSTILDKLSIPDGQRNFAHAGQLSWKSSEIKSQKISPENVVIFKKLK